MVETTSESVVAERVSIRAMNKWYGNFHVLCDVDLSVPAGETLAICGRSGSGKSTLIRCIAGLEPFQSGELTVLGVSLEPRAPQNHRRLSGVAMVFQGFNLFPHLTVLQNLTLGPLDVSRMGRAEARDLAMHQLRRMKMEAYADRYPVTLSGGQQQRAAIARALCMEPQLMLFDEPTSALDPELRTQVRGAITDLAKDGMTIIIVTHEMELARDVASRTILMDDGATVTGD